MRWPLLPGLVLIALLATSRADAAQRRLYEVPATTPAAQFELTTRDLPPGVSSRLFRSPIGNRVDLVLHADSARTSPIGKQMKLTVVVAVSIIDAEIEEQPGSYTQDPFEHFANPWQPRGIGDFARGEGGAPDSTTVSLCTTGASAGYYLLFRRSNVKVALAADGCKGVIDPDRLAHYARLVDQRILTYLRTHIGLPYCVVPPGATLPGSCYPSNGT